MQRFKTGGFLVCSVLFVQLLQTAVAQGQSTMRFAAERDTSITGLRGEQFANHGYWGWLRGKKQAEQHQALIDWDTDAINAWLAANAVRIEDVRWTLNIYPLESPGSDVEIQTLESLNDWAEGNGGVIDWAGDGDDGSFENFNWEAGTLASTTNFAQTAFKIDDEGDRVLDLENSLPWIDNDSGTGGINDNQYGVAGRGDNFSQGIRIPDFFNREPFYGVDLDDAAFNLTYASVPLDGDVVNALLNDPNNRGLIFGLRDGGNDWRFWSREGAEGGGGETANVDPGTWQPVDLGEPVPSPFAPFLEITFGGDPIFFGDFDESGVLDLPDVNMLNVEINAGTDDGAFDLNEDAMVNAEDQRIWVKELKKTWFGDANLDGLFNSADLVSVLGIGKFDTDEDAGWEEGDWTGDLRFNLADVVKSLADGGFDQGPLVATAAVPEPSSFVILTVLSLGLMLYRRS